MIFQKTSVNNRYYASPSPGGVAPAKSAEPPAGAGPVGPPATGLPKLLSLTTQSSSSIISVAGGGGGGSGGNSGADSQAGVSGGVRPADYMHISSAAVAGKPPQNTEEILQFRIRPSVTMPAPDPLTHQSQSGKSATSAAAAAGHGGLRHGPSILRKRGKELAQQANNAAAGGSAGRSAAPGDPAACGGLNCNSGASDASPRKRARKQQLQPDSASQLLAAAAAAAAASFGTVESAATLSLTNQHHSASHHHPQPPPGDPGGVVGGGCNAVSPAGHASIRPTALRPSLTPPLSVTPLATRHLHQHHPPPVSMQHQHQHAGAIRLIKEDPSELVVADTDLALGSHENVGPDSPTCSPEDEQYRRMLRVLEEEPYRPQVYSRPRACLLSPEQLCPTAPERGRARLGHFLRPADVRRVEPVKRAGPIELGRSARGLASGRRVCGLADGLDDLRRSEERLATRLLAVSRRLATSGTSAAGCAAAIALTPASSPGLGPKLQQSAQPSRVLAELLTRTRTMLLDLLSCHAPSAFAAMRAALAAAAAASSSSLADDDELVLHPPAAASSALALNLNSTCSSRRQRRRTTSFGLEASDAS